MKDKIYKDFGFSDEKIQKIKFFVETHPFKEGRFKKIGAKSDLRKKQFNFLEPLVITDEIKDGGYTWICKCTCSKLKKVSARSLIKNEVKSCGCLRALKTKKEHFKGIGDIGLDFWNDKIEKAKNRNIDFNISIEYAYLLFLKQNKKCALTGLDLSFDKDLFKNKYKASLDRIDSSKPYEVGNVQWVAKEVNLLKNKFSEKYLYNICRDVISYEKISFERIDDFVNNSYLMEKYGYNKKYLKISKLKFLGIGELSQVYFNSLKKNANKRNIDFKININDIWNKYLEQGGVCALTGKPIFFSRNIKKIEQTASVDRIDSSVGYIKDNIQIVHKNINLMKNTLSNQEFINLCKLIYENKGRDKFPSEIVAVSGGFDPLHFAHCEMIQEAGEIAQVVVILNTDEWLIRKKGYAFMSFEERKYILECQKNVVLVVKADDTDDTVCRTLEKIRPDIFANGGDRKDINTPEVALCQALGIETLWNVGGEKKQSSSELVAKAKKHFTI